MRTFPLTAQFAATPALSAADQGTRQPAGAIAEIVTFRLLDGRDPSAFVAAARDLQPFPAGTGAMVARTLSQDDTGLWSDHITWTSLSAARSAATQMIDRPEAQPVMAMIAPDSLALGRADFRLQQH